MEAEGLSKAPELNPQVCSDEKTTEGGTHPGFAGEICAARATRIFLPAFRPQPFQPSTVTCRSPFYIYDSAARVNKRS